MTVTRPGAAIGLLGGGQLGRMTAMAARSLGYDVHVLDPDPDCSARPLASRVLAAPFTDVDAAIELARGVDVVSLEIEQIARPVLDAVAGTRPLRPRAEAVWIIQDRLRQRQWLTDQHFPVGPWREAQSADECAAAVDQLGASICKAPHGGYDGRGQVRVTSPTEAVAAWQTLGSERCLVEKFLDLELECSVLVARGPTGEVAVYGAARNHHERGVLDWSTFPGPIDPLVEAAATEIARGIAESLDVVGLLACELFLSRDGQLLVNELAPRPHNTYHHSERAAMTSQFEQFVRAICGLPLGLTSAVAPGAIANLLGDLWSDGEPDHVAALSVPGVRLHLYGKVEARRGRKMGHISALGRDTGEALERVLEARRRFRR
ncbi:MAG: 5-(carboxyamino)imidazole ribonucleotide synthase [Gemmatimonadota bacterium]